MKSTTHKNSAKALVLASVLLLAGCDEPQQAPPPPRAATPQEMYEQGAWNDLAQATGKEAGKYQDLRGFDLEKEGMLDNADEWYKLASANGMEYSGFRHWHFFSPRHWETKEYIVIGILGLCLLLYFYENATKGKKTPKPQGTKRPQQPRQTNRATGKPTTPPNSPWLHIPKGTTIYLDTCLLMENYEDTNVYNWFSLILEHALDNNWTVVVPHSVLLELDMLKESKQEARAAINLLSILKDKLGRRFEFRGERVTPADPEFNKLMLRGDYLCTLDKALALSIDGDKDRHAPAPKLLTKQHRQE